VTRGLVGFAVFCFLLAILLVPFGVPSAFAAAIAGTLVVQVAWAALASRRRSGPIGADGQRAILRNE
jgi:hypothetical protein